MTRGNSRNQMVLSAHFWCGIWGCFCVSRSIALVSKVPIGAEERKQQKMKKTYSKDTVSMLKTAEACGHAVQANVCTNEGIH